MTHEPSIALIIEATATATGISAREIKSSRRDAPFMLPRHVVYHLSCKLTTKSLPAIGRAVGGRDHHTVFTGRDRAGERYATEPDFKELADAVELAVLAIMQSSIATILGDPNPLAIAEHITAHPELAVALRVSADNVRAMAYRVVDLEDIAVDAMRLVRLLERFLAAPAGTAQRQKLADATRGGMRGLTAKLSDLNITEKTANDSHSAADA